MSRRREEQVRDENIIADCYVLYNEDDLGKHFTLLNQTNLSIKEIKQVWKAIKEDYQAQIDCIKFCFRDRPKSWLG